jgi:hypothetical protein
MWGGGLRKCVVKTARSYLPVRFDWLQLMVPVMSANSQERLASTATVPATATDDNREETLSSAYSISDQPLEQPKKLRIACIGAGVSGILTAIKASTTLRN